MRYGISIWLFCLAVIKGVWVNLMFWFWELGESSPGGFVQRAGNIPLWTVSHSDFPLRRRELKTWVRCFTPFWVIQVELQNVVVWKTFVSQLGEQSTHTKSKISQHKKTHHFGNKSTKTSKTLLLCDKFTSKMVRCRFVTFSSILTIFYDFHKMKLKIWG